MRKIPTLYERNPERRSEVLMGQVTPGCEWVLRGEGRVTRKLDGTCVMHDGEAWWARREVKPGKTPPDGWQEAAADEVTGKRQGWEPIEQSPFVAAWRDALAHRVEPRQPAGTYELCGPKIQGNPENLVSHELVVHGAFTVEVDDPQPVQALMRVCTEQGWEGIVWHHPDGRMAKLKVRDLPAAAPRASREPT